MAQDASAGRESREREEWTPDDVVSGRYSIVRKIGEGTYGTVWKGLDLESNQQEVALKRINLEDADEGIPSTTIREISLLMELRHANIVELYNVLHEERHVSLVFEYLNQGDLRRFLDSIDSGLSSPILDSLLFQLLRGVAYCHRHRVLHRDLKPQNLLLNRRGELKLADFGLARSFGIPARSRTTEVVTLWYRAPEVLLGDVNYSTPVDMWSVGCIFAEMMTGKPLFTGTDPRNQLQSIMRQLGTPTAEEYPSLRELSGWVDIEDEMQFPKPKEGVAGLIVGTEQSEEAIDLLGSFLAYDPQKRVKAVAAVEHAFFADLRSTAWRSSAADQDRTLK